MRIIGGTHGGRKIRSPEGKNTRPTTDFVREALFNILGSYVVESNILDVFAGTGAVGLEALSRGAQTATFIEKDPKAFLIIKQNLKDLNLQDKAFLIKDDALSALKNLDKKGQSFDIIFMDPPYNENHIKPCMEFLRKSTVLKNGDVLIVQYPKNESMDYEGFLLKKHKVYGRTALSFFAKE